MCGLSNDKLTLIGCAAKVNHFANLVFEEACSSCNWGFVLGVNKSKTTKILLFCLWNVKNVRVPHVIIPWPYHLKWVSLGLLKQVLNGGKNRCISQWSGTEFNWVFLNLVLFLSIISLTVFIAWQTLLVAKELNS